MKKLSTILMVLLFATASTVQAQYYINSFPSAGTNPGGLNTDSEFPNGGGLPGGWTALVGPSVANPTWSANQTIPFSFSFNASPVTQYKVSSTGVLTFNTSAATAPAATPVALPSASVPDMSVCILGIAATGSNDYALSKTFGTAPNRQHWVFFSSHALGGSGWSYWSIVLEETTNNIYIVDQRHNGTTGGVSAGLQINSTTAVSVAGSPSYTPLAGTDATPVDNSYYAFIQGTRPANNINMVDFTIGKSVPAGMASNVTGILENSGSDTLKSFTLSYSINGGAVNSQVINATVAPQSTYNFSHPTTWSPVGGVYQLEMYSSLPNGMADANPSNDTLRQAVVASSGVTVSKNVLLEEFTTAPCQFCPDGAVVVESILLNNPSVIAVGEHACFGTDAMTIPEAQAYCAAFSNGAPTATVDRVLFPGQTSVGHSRNAWANNCNTQASLGSSVGVTLTGSYNPTTRAASIDFNANFVDYSAGDMRVTLFVVEDSVTGTGNGYNQVNAYNTQSGHPYAGAGNPIVGFVHKHVLRDVYPTNDAWGEAGIIPASPVLNTNYTKNYSFSLNSAWKEKDVSLVGFVSYYNADPTQREVLNAFEVKLNSLVTDVDELSIEKNGFNLYPNPSTQLTYVEFDLYKNSHINLDIIDITGKTVVSENYGVMGQGNQKLQIDVSSLPSGFYFVNLNVEGKIISKKLSVVK